MKVLNFLEYLIEEEDPGKGSFSSDEITFRNGVFGGTVFKSNRKFDSIDISKESPFLSKDEKYVLGIRNWDKITGFKAKRKKGSKKEYQKITLENKGAKKEYQVGDEGFEAASRFITRINDDLYRSQEEKRDPSFAEDAGNEASTKKISGEDSTYRLLLDRSLSALITMRSILPLEIPSDKSEAQGILDKFDVYKEIANIMGSVKGDKSSHTQMWQSIQKLASEGEGYIQEFGEIWGKSAAKPEEGETRSEMLDRGARDLASSREKFAVTGNGAARYLRAAIDTYAKGGLNLLESGKVNLNLLQSSIDQLTDQFKNGGTPTVTGQGKDEKETEKKEEAGGEPEKSEGKTTPKAIQAKKEAIKILEDLISNATGWGSGIKKGKWEKSLENIKSIKDDQLCSEKTIQDLKKQSVKSKEDLENNRAYLTKEEEKKCENLIKMLDEYPSYCEVNESYFYKNRQLILERAGEIYERKKSDDSDYKTTQEITYGSLLNQVISLANVIDGFIAFFAGSPYEKEVATSAAKYQRPLQEAAQFLSSKNFSEIRGSGADNEKISKITKDIEKLSAETGELSINEWKKTMMEKYGQAQISNEFLSAGDKKVAQAQEILNNVAKVTSLKQKAAATQLDNIITNIKDTMDSGGESASTGKIDRIGGGDGYTEVVDSKGNLSKEGVKDLQNNVSKILGTQSSGSGEYDANTKSEVLEVKRYLTMLTGRSYEKEDGSPDLNQINKDIKTFTEKRESILSWLGN